MSSGGEYICRAIGLPWYVQAGDHGEFSGAERFRRREDSREPVARQFLHLSPSVGSHLLLILRHRSQASEKCQCSNNRRAGPNIPRVPRLEAAAAAAAAEPGGGSLSLSSSSLKRCGFPGPSLSDMVVAVADRDVDGGSYRGQCPMSSAANVW